MTGEPSPCHASYDAGGNVISVRYITANDTNEYYYLRNAQNDIVKLIDASGVTVVEYTYDTWGKKVTTTGTLAGTLGLIQPFRYRGYVYDYETGFYYLQSRYYDPTTGRFISADVYLSTDQGVIGNNTFVYCGDNPVNRIDSEGNCWHILIGAAIGAVIGAVSSLVTSAINGEDFSDGKVWAKAAVGAVAGAVTGALSATGLPAVGQAVAGAAVGAVEEIVTQKINNPNEKINWGQVGISAGIGAIAGAIGGDGMSKTVKLKTLNRNLTKKVFSKSAKVMKKGIKYYFSQTKTLYKKALIEPLLTSGGAALLGNSIKTFVGLDRN